jgi:hypothetical protein
MLILADRQDWPDHPYPDIDRHRKGENDRISAHCPWSWWFACAHTDIRTVGGKKIKEQCSRRHRISCDGGRHISLDLAEVALQQAGWHRISNKDDGGWRCPRH